MPRTVRIRLIFLEGDEEVGTVTLDRHGTTVATGSQQPEDFALVSAINDVLRSVKFRFKYTARPPKAAKPEGPPPTTAADGSPLDDD